MESNLLIKTEISGQGHAGEDEGTAGAGAGAGGDPKKRACDGCRSRKRKCDGILPYCTNCKRSTTRDADNNPVCTYSAITKKRGPKKGFKDGLMQRLESLEHVLNPLEEAANSALKKQKRTQGWTTEQQPLTALLHASSHLFDYEADTHTTNTNVSSSEWKGEETGGATGKIADALLRGGTHSYEEPLHSLESSNQSAQSHLIRLSSASSASDLPSFPFVEEEFELSLIRLGLQYCTITTNFRLSLMLGEGHQMHLKGIHQCLRLALCAHGLFYSTHPYIETNLLSRRSNSKASREEPIVELVSKYLAQASKMIPQSPSSEIELVDSVRALMVIVAGYFALGMPKEGGSAKARISSYAKKWHLFDPCVFNPVAIPPTGPTVDGIRVLYGLPIDEYRAPILSDIEMKERFSLWEECMAIDTLSSMVSGGDFDFDETEYPSVFLNPALGFNEALNVDLNRKFERRLTVRMGARNSIWGSTAFASEFDEIRELTAVSSLHFSAGLVQYRLAIIRVCRRAMRYARETAKGANQRFPGDNLRSIHGMFITHLESLPPSFMPFLSLVQFTTPHEVAGLNSQWKRHISFHHDLLIFLCSMSYIHLPNIDSNLQTFQMASSTLAYCNSRDVLIAILRATVGMVQVLYTTEHQFSPQPLPSSDPPAPGLCTMQSVVALYVIATSALLAGRASGNTQTQLQVEQLIVVWICPAIHRIASVKPFAKQYYSKLQEFLRAPVINVQLHQPNLLLTPNPFFY